MKDYNYPLNLSMGEISDLENALTDFLFYLRNICSERKLSVLEANEVKRLNQLLIKIKRTEPERVCVEDNQELNNLFIIVWD